MRRIGVQSALMSGENNESGYIRAGNWTVSRDDIATCRRQMMKTKKKKSGKRIKSRVSSISALIKAECQKANAELRSLLPTIPYF